MSQNLHVTVLAAGRGTRMQNDLAKVLHPLAGRTLIEHVMAVASELDPATVVAVLGEGMDDVAAACRKVLPEARVAIQESPQGTGHALVCAAPLLPASGVVLVLYGDTPLVTAGTLRRLLEARDKTGAAVAVLGMRPPDPSGYGRLEMDAEGLRELVEERHASAELRRDGACNSGVMAIDAARLGPLLEAIPFRADKQEYYLTDIVRLARERGWRCTAIDGDWHEGVGVNSQPQLAQAGGYLQERLRAAAMAAGVVMEAPDTVFLAADTVIEPGAVIEPYVVFGPGCHVGAGARVHAFCHLTQARVAAGAEIGPYARLRPGSDIGEGAKLGNFVETKNARLEPGAKVSHLSYIGDAVIGAKANIGAGTITCNYDGFGKYRTEIGAGAFIGSNTALVAPITVGAGAVVAAGSTLTEDVPGDAVAIARSRQTTRAGAAPALRERQKRRKGG